MLRPILFGLLIALPHLHACSCVIFDSPCDKAWSAGQTILLGKVTAMEKTANSDPRVFLSSNAARLTVEESYSGDALPGTEVVILTGMGGGDCGYPFIPGRDYLVYASMGADGLLHASICSQTVPAVWATGTIRELRAMRDHTRMDDVFGTVGIAPKGNGGESLTETQPLPGIVVHATDATGKAFSTKTDERGAYSFTTLAAGTYRIEAEPPSGFSRSAPFPVEIGSACRADHFLKPDGRIQGMVVDAAGKPLSGFVTIEPSDPSTARAARQRGGLPGEDIGADGRFTLPHLPPDRYRLIFYLNLTRRPDFRHPFYSPDIEVGLGQHVDAFEFKVAQP